MTKLSNEELTAEAARWVESDLAPPRLVDAPEAVPRHGESVSISMRLPKVMLSILREFARREGVGYQVLVKRWLDERIRVDKEESMDGFTKLQKPVLDLEVRVNVSDLRSLLNDRDHSIKQIRELQVRLNELVLEVRELKKLSTTANNQ